MDEREFDALYAGASRRLVAVTFAACGNLQEAQDCVQEAFVRAWSHRAELDASGAPEAWVRTTAVRLAVSRWRRLRGLERALIRSGPPPTPPEPGELRTDLLRALAALPPRTRMVLALHYLADLPLADIAAQTRLPVGTVKSHLSRGRARLRTLLGGPDSGTAHSAPSAKEPDRA